MIFFEMFRMSISQNNTLHFNFFHPHSPAPGARAEAVYSANVVGYTKITLTGRDILGMQFETVGIPEIPLNIQDIKATGLDSYIDSISVWNGLGYDPFVYYGSDAEGGVYESDGETLVGPGWGDENQIASDITLVAGSGFWLNPSSEAVITIAGQVSSEDSVSVPAGRTQISNPFPINLAIRNIGAIGLVSYVDSLSYWNGTGYESMIFYGEDAEGGVYESDGETLIGPGFGDENQIVSDVTIGIGKGFWIGSTSSAIITFPKPLIQTP